MAVAAKRARRDPRSAKLVDVLQRICSTLIRAPHHRLEKAIDEALAAFGEAAGADRAVIATRPAGQFVQRHAWPRTRAVSPDANRALDVLFEEIEHEETVVCPDRAHLLSAARRAGGAVAGIASGMFVPLRSEAAAGVLAVTRRTPHAWSAETIDAAERLADMLGAAFDRMTSQSSLAQEQEARHQAEAETRRLREQLAHAGRVTMLGELAASLAHEINQPLTAIYTNVQAAHRFLDRPRPAVSEALAALEDLAQDCRRAADVIERLRQMFRRHETERVPLQMGAVAEHVLRLLHEDAIARGVRLSLETARGLPDVHGDRVQLEQVVMNLVVNAFDAVSVVEGERLVTVRISAGAGSVRVAVLDTGRGIQPADLERIFEPFFTRKRQGMGIGLAICRTIVEAHAGHISARNRAECGSCFEITFPAVPAATVSGASP